MNLNHPFALKKITLDLGQIDAFRHAVHRKVHAVSGQSPSAREYDCRDAQADRRIDPQPAGPHDKQRSNDYAKRNSGVRYHVQISTANIQVAMTTSHEQ